MKKIIIIWVVMCLLPSLTDASTLPISTNHPHIFLTSARLAAMQAKQSRSVVDWMYVVSRMSSYGSRGTYPYNTAEASASFALLYQVDNSRTSDRDRAIELLFDFFVEQDSGHYFGITATGSGLTTLNSSIDSRATTISLSDITGFSVPGTGTGWILIERELISFTGISGATLTGCTRGAGGTTAVAHDSAIEVENALITFGDGDKFRWYTRYGLYAFDWLYNDLTSTQRQQMQDKIYAWGKFWTNQLTVNISESNWAADTDVLTGLSETLLLSALCLYNDDPYASDLFDSADSLLSYIESILLNGHMAGGIWGEGMNYSAYTLQFVPRCTLVNYESRNIAYPSITSAYINSTIQGWLHLTLPGYTGMLPYSDMETFSYSDGYLPFLGHSRLQASYIFEGTTTDSTSAELMRYWQNQVIRVEGEPTNTEMYSGIYRLLFHDSSGTVTAPTSTNAPLAMQADGTNFVLMRTGWGSTDDAVYTYGHEDAYDHSHWAAGHYDIVSDGIYITKELTGYGYTIVSGQTKSHNCLEIEAQSSTNWSIQRGSYSVGDAVIDTMVSTDTYGYIQYDLKNLYNYDGYSPENPIDVYKRRFFWVKDAGVMIVYDFIDVSDDSDCTWNDKNHAGSGVACKPRGKVLHQRFLAKPTLSDSVYSATNEGKTFFYHPILPSSGVTRTIIDESVTTPWSTASTADVPTAQKAYQVITESDGSSDPDRFMSVLNWGDSGRSSAVSVNSISGTGVTGVVIGGVTAVIVPDNGNSVSVGDSYTADATTHYIADIQESEKVEILRNGVSLGYFSAGRGVVTFTAPSGSAKYSIERENTPSIINISGTSTQ